MVGDRPACSAKLEEKQRRDEIDRVVAGQRPLRTLFSEDQERLVREYAPIGISWHELSVLGPVEVRKWEFELAALPHEVAVEGWVLPDERGFIELSIKVPPDQAVDAGTAQRDVLVKRGLDPYGDQQAKTRMVLEFFTAPD